MDNWFYLLWHLRRPMSWDRYCPRSLHTPSVLYPCWVWTALSAEPLHLNSQETDEKCKRFEFDVLAFEFKWN